MAKGMVELVEKQTGNDTRSELIAHLKRNGPSSVRELMQALTLSENAVRHRLGKLEFEGFVEQQRQRSEKGRPAQAYVLTEAAEGLFPKQYRELLELVLSEAQSQGVLPMLMHGVAQRLSDQLKPALEHTHGEGRMQRLRDLLDVGEMLHLERTPAGFELRAYNCLYRAAGSKFEAVCDLVPSIIGLVLGSSVDRPACQRDGQRACVFSIVHGV
jgi:predicted ArsR family transcriptional regulator